MTLSIWRYAHLTLAIISSLFLLILAITGVILAVDAIDEKTPNYRAENFDDINLAQSIPALRKAYSEVIDLTVDYNQFVKINALDNDGNTVHAYINPLTGEQLAPVQSKSTFIQWTTALHRSLFLKETGRTIVGIVSFLLFLITISGFILIIKRQQGIRHFFDKINRDFFSQYFHVITGRWLLVPVLIIALTGTYIFLARLDFFKQENIEVEHLSNRDESVAKEIEEIPLLQNIRLADIEKIEFPFIPDDPDEPFIIHLRDRSLSVNQVNGNIIKESLFPYSAVLEKLNLDLHTGRTSIIWAIILGLASLNILFFIYTGFAITFKRTHTKIKNKFKAETAEIIILVGSENGTTLFFANQIHKQLLADGKHSFLSEMNQYCEYPNAKHLLIFTSTYGLGDPPSNASRFEQLIVQHAQNQPIFYSVIGFGSRAYKDFCAYANRVDQLLSKEQWTTKLVDLHTVNDRSTDDFVKWVHQWSEKALIALTTAPGIYSGKIPGLKKFKVIEKTNVSQDNMTFKIVIEPIGKNKFESGDLLAIYPAQDNRERFYSIGRSQNRIQLIVKLHPNGFGSGYLHKLSKDNTIKARIISNPKFHFPQQTPAVAMIANGTGIAPFLGMIANNISKTPIYLYAGFRHNNMSTQQYRQFADTCIKEQLLIKFELAYSRERQSQYVMDLIKKNTDHFMKLLDDGGVIMICGSLNMQHDIEKVLDSLTLAIYGKPLTFYKDNNQILTDCY